MAIFGLINWLVGFEVAIAVLITLGLIGIVFHQKNHDFNYQKIRGIKI